MAACRDRLAAALRQAFRDVAFNASFEHTLPTTLNFSVPGVSGKTLLDLFDAAGVRVSAGSACSAARAAPSYVLQAMGLPDARCANAVRMSFGPLADDALIDEACARILRCGRALASAPPLGAEPGLPAIDPAGADELAVDAAGLARFLAQHPGALLVDVREACEHAAGTPCLHGRAAYSLPLSRLAEHAGWLRKETRPLVFFCRSGNRSARAAQLVRGWGHPSVRHLAGGLALFPG